MKLENILYSREKKKKVPLGMRSADLGNICRWDSERRQDKRGPLVNVNNKRNGWT